MPAVTQETLDEVVENIKEAFISDNNADKFARIHLYKEFALSTAVLALKNKRVNQV